MTVRLADRVNRISVSPTMAVLVEAEKLRARGMDPAFARGDFATIDRERRYSITQGETLKARRNKAYRRYATAVGLDQDVNRHLDGIPLGACRVTWI